MPERERRTPPSGTDAPFIGMEHVASNSGVVAKPGRAAGIRSASPVVRAGDVLYGRLRPYLNKVTNAPFDAYASGEFIVLRPEGGLDPRFLRWRLASPDFVDYAVSQNSGDRPSVKWGQVAPFGLGLPPLEEQRRIVDTLEDHLSRLDAASHGLAHATTRSDMFQASSLATTWNEALAVRGMRTVAEVGTVVTGSTPNSRQGEPFGGHIPFLTPSDVGHGVEVTKWTRSLNDQGMSMARPLSPGTVLVVCIGATLGKVGWIGQTATSNQQINAVIPLQGFRTDFVAALMAAPQFQQQMRSAASSTTLPILNKSRFSRLVLPVPPADVQDRLMEAYRLTAEGRVRLQLGLKKLEVRHETLRRSILAAAFSGQLSAEIGVSPTRMDPAVV